MNHNSGKRAADSLGEPSWPSSSNTWQSSLTRESEANGRLAKVQAEDNHQAAGDGRVDVAMSSTVGNNQPKPLGIEALLTAIDSEETPQQRRDRLRKELDDLTAEEEAATLERQIREAKKRKAQGYLAPSEPERSRSAPRSDSSKEETPLEPRKRLRLEENQLYLPPPPEYEAKNQKECYDFIASCESFFSGNKTIYKSDREKVTMASRLLRNKPMEQWRQRLNETSIETTSWEAFKSWLLDALKPEVIRAGYVARRYKNARQRQDEAVPSFVAFIDELEAQMESQPETVRMNYLTFSFREEITDEILRTRDTPKTRNDLIFLATQIEENLNAVKRTKSRAYAPQRDNSQARGRSLSERVTFPYHGAVVVQTEGSTTVRKTTQHHAQPKLQGSSDVCDYCKKPGHLAKCCWSLHSELKPVRKTTQHHTQTKLQGSSTFCDHCKKPGHQTKGCWNLHPGLKPKKFESPNSKANHIHKGQ